MTTSGTSALRVSPSVVTDGSRHGVQKTTSKHSRKQNRPSLKLLIVDDEFFLATDLRKELDCDGFDVVGMCPDLAAAKAFISANEIDCVVLDLNLGNGISFEMARELSARDIPFVFVTGYDLDAITRDFRHSPYLVKPAPPDRLKILIRSACNRMDQV